MKILFLNGSPRKNGYTANIMKYIEKGINSKHSVEWIHAYDLNVKPCLSCLKCRPDNKCFLPEDDGQIVWTKLRSADCLIIGSPTYFGSISGQLKLIIDRNLTALEKINANGLEIPIPLHKDKKAAMVTSCNTPYPMSQLPNQSKGTLQTMKSILKSGGYNIIGSITLDGAAIKNEIPLEIQKQAKIIGNNL